MIIRYKRVTSTNDRARDLAQAGAKEWTVVVSEVQTQGRGRSGKKWQSNKGGLWFSILLRPHISPGSVAILQFFASNAIRKAIVDETGLATRTKWPNDILLETGKLAGILVESKSQGSQLSFVTVGIGLNVNQSQSTLSDGATSIYATSREKHSIEHLMSRIIENMQDDYAILEAPDRILSEWWTDSIHRSKNVEIQTGDGTRTGISMGIDSNGSLLLETDGRTENIMEGTLRILNEQKRSSNAMLAHPSLQTKS